MMTQPRSRCFADEFELLPTSLGSGMSGEVLLGRCRIAGGLVAVKTLSKQGLTKKQQYALLREVDIYSRLDHANITRLLRVFDEDDKTYLVMEYCSGGNLGEKLLEKRRFEEKEAAVAVHQALSAIAYCHSQKVVHRDIKLVNFVYNSKDGALKLLDFGVSRLLAPGAQLPNSIAGTLEFMAPEVLRGEQHGQGCDIWAIGVIAHSLLTGKLPFDGVEDRDVERAILGGSLELKDEDWAGISEHAKAFVQGLLSNDPAERPSAKTALLTPWMTMVAPRIDAADTQILRKQDLRGIEGFASENSMRRAAAAMAVYSKVDLEGDDVKLADLQFQTLDTDGSGAISEKELTQVLQSELGITAERCRSMFDQLDLLGNREIHRSEFLAAVVGTRLLRSESGSLTELRKAFNCFDQSRDGKIHLNELVSVLGKTFCGKPTQDIFLQLDTNCDQMIDFSEFSSMVNAP